MNIPLKKMLMTKAALTKTPLSGTFELTPRCNLHCRMCYIRMTESQMRPYGREYTAQEWIALGREGMEQGLLYLLLTGGEPMLRPDFDQIYTALRNMGLFLSVNSNGTLIDEGKIALFRHNLPQALNITLYGACNETYHRLCGLPDGFDRVRDSILRLLDAGIPVQLNVTLTRDNIDDLEQIVRFGQDNSLPLRISNYTFPPLRKEDGHGAVDSIRFTESECGMARLRTINAQLSPEEVAQVRERFCKGQYDMEPDNGCEEGAGMDCTAGRCSFWVTWNGKMYPCGMLPLPETRPFEDGFSKAWGEITHFIQQVTLPGECSNCPAKSICRPCGAIVHAENGCFSKKPDYLCRSTAEYIRLMKG